MRRTRHSFLVVGVSVFTTLIASAAIATSSRPQQPMMDRSAVATEVFAADQLTLETGASFDRAVLTVSGPKRFRVRQEFGPGEAIGVDFAGADLADGRYRYSLRLSPRTDRGAVKMGLFYVENGAIVSRDSKRSQLDAIRGRLNLSRRDKVEEAVAQLGSKRERQAGSRPGDLHKSGGKTQIAPSPGAYVPYNGGIFGGYVGIFGYGPMLYFSEGPYYPYYYPPPTGVPPYYAGMTGAIMQYYGVNYRLSLYANYDYSYYNINVAYYNMNIGYGNYNYGFINYDSGYQNIRQAYDANVDLAYINYMGTYYGGLNLMLAFGIDYGYGFYGGYNILGGIGLTPAAGPSGSYDVVYSYMYVGPLGLGINTLAPYAEIEIYDHYDFAALRLNNGVATFAFAVNPSGQFTINKIDSGGQELSVNERYDGGGIPTVDVQGSVRGTQFIASSSRDLKTDFSTVDGKKVLSQLSQVPVMSWRYKNEDDSARHFGPVAEDFRAAFQLGDGKTISSIDADGVTMAAIQGLHLLLEEQQAALERKDQEMTELRQRLAVLEELVRGQSPGDS